MSNRRLAGRSFSLTGLREDRSRLTGKQISLARWAMACSRTRQSAAFGRPRSGERSYDAERSIKAPPNRPEFWQIWPRLKSCHSALIGSLPHFLQQIELPSFSCTRQSAVFGGPRSGERSYDAQRSDQGGATLNRFRPSALLSPPLTGPTGASQNLDFRNHVWRTCFVGQR